MRDDQVGSARAVVRLATASALTLFLGACSSLNLPSIPEHRTCARPGVAPEMPATIRPDEIVGRWGLASFQNPDDRARTEKMARDQCKQPYVITPASSAASSCIWPTRPRRRNCG